MLKKSRYAVRPLLLLGIIFCMHENDEQKRDRIWFLLNPEMEELVALEAIGTLYDLASQICVSVWLGSEDARRGAEREQEVVNYLMEV